MVRTRMVLGPLVLAVGLAGLAAAAEPAAPPKTVRIGMISTMFRDIPQGMFQVVSKPFNGLMEKSTGLNGDLVLAKDAEALARQIADKETHLGVFHGFEYAWLRKKYPSMQPLVIAVNQAPKLYACLVVRKDGPNSCMNDLKGKTIALGRGTKEHVRLYLERIKPASEELKPFAQISTPETIEDALDDVVDDIAQATVVDTTILAGFQQRKPGRAARLKVVTTSEPFPASVIVYNREVMDEAVLTRLRDGLSTAHKSKYAKDLMSLWRLSRFDTVPADYEAQLEAVAKAYPPPPPPDASEER